MTSIFFAAASVVGLFALGFIISWLIFKTIQHQLSLPERTHSPADTKELDSLRLQIAKTKVDAEHLRLKTEKIRLRALEDRVGVLTGEEFDNDNSDDLDNH